MQNYFIRRCSYYCKSGEEFETPQSSRIKENIFDGKCPAGYWRKCGERRLVSLRVKKQKNWSNIFRPNFRRNF